MITIQKPKKNKKFYKIYLREPGQAIDPSNDRINVNFKDSEPKKIFAGIMQTENALVGTISSIYVKINAKINKKKVERTFQLQFRIVSDFTKPTKSQKDYEFSLRTDKFVLLVAPGEQEPLIISVNNFGLKSDSIKLTIFQTLPMGWTIRPHHLRMKLKPGESDLRVVYIDAPSNVLIGEGGNLTIKAESKGNRDFIQTKIVRVIAAKHSKWNSD